MLAEFACSDRYATEIRTPHAHLTVTWGSCMTVSMNAPIGAAPGLAPPQATISPALTTAPAAAATTLPAPTDLTSALAALSQALEGLQQVLASMQPVQGGGATVPPSSGCSCCASMQVGS